MGNGGFTIEYPPLHQLASSRQPVIRAVDRLLTYLDPEPHRRTFMKPFMRLDSAEFCSTCHKVHLDVPVNDYRWIPRLQRLRQLAGERRLGPGRAIVLLPGASRRPASTATCRACRRATPAGTRTAWCTRTASRRRTPRVPFVNHDAEQLKVTTDFLTSGFISVDIFAVSPVDEKSGAHADGAPVRRRRRGDVDFAVGEEAEQTAPVVIREVGKLAAPLDRAAPVLTPGSTVRLDVVVRTRKIGHFFPGGTVDAFDVWLELQGRDADGRTIFWSGQVDDDGRGPVEPGAHFYRSYQLDGARQSDRQAQCLADAEPALRPADSARAPPMWRTTASGFRRTPEGRSRSRRS